MSRKFEVVSPNFRKNPGVEIKLPERATRNSAGYDIFSPVDATIMPEENVMIWTDVKVSMFYDNVLLINVRSSMGKHPVMLSNTQGWVDSDYYSNPDNDGNIGVRLFNMGTEPYVIKAGDRIAQAMFTKYMITIDDTANSVRTGGFGSTGV